MYKVVFFALSLSVTGCFSPKNTQDENLAGEVQATMQIMQDYAKALPFVESARDYKDPWGFHIYSQYVVSNSEPYLDEYVLSKYAKLALPKEAKNIKILGKEWVQFAIGDVTTNACVAIPRLFKEKIIAIKLHSNGPRNGKLKNGVDLTVRKEFEVVRGYMCRDGKLYGDQILLSLGNIQQIIAEERLSDVTTNKSTR